MNVEMSVMAATIDYGATGVDVYQSVRSGATGQPTPVAGTRPRNLRANTAAPVPLTSLPNADGQGSSWRAHLYAETGRVARAIKKSVAEEHQRVKNSNANLRIVCQACSHHKHSLDLVVFNCVQKARGTTGETRDKHRFCTECVSKLLAEMSRGVKHINCAESVSKLCEVQHRCNNNLRIAVCPLCRCPNVLISAVRFHETFDRDRIDSRLQFTSHLGATQILSENFSVERVCENQRRPFFGAFSQQNLLVVDFCGAISTERETNVCEIENLSQTAERPNKSWAWMEDWSPDLSLNSRGGWRYARNFDAPWPGLGWGAEPTMLSFVRRRRLLRTRVRFNEEVMSALQNYFEEREQEET
jgi:hypothetical protein